MPRTADIKSTLAKLPRLRELKIGAKRGKSRTQARRTTPVDFEVGRNVRRARIELGISQTELATASNITFQQIQKYENGANRVSASRLWQFAAILAKPVTYFFEGLGTPTMKLPARIPTKKRTKAEVKIDDDTAKIARKIASIQDERLKRRLKTMLTALASGERGLV